MTITYKIQENGVLQDLGSGAQRFIPEEHPAYQDYLAWLAEGNTPEAADPPPSPPADWRGFLEALRATTVFAALRGQARMDVGANALATELRAALGEAALGLVDVDTVQGLLNELLPTLPAPQVAEIDAGIVAFHVPLTTEAPAP